MWTEFNDMHSGGDQKEKFSHCFIEVNEEQAKSVFFARFGHNPERVSCTCCGSDYSITTHETLQAATGFERGCEYVYIDKETGDEVVYNQPNYWDLWHAKRLINGHYVERFSTSTLSFHKEYIPLEDYIKRPDVCVIYATDIQPEELTQTVPEQGYVWQG